MKTQDKKIYFSLPDFWEKYNLNLTLLQLYNEERDKFYDDIVIDNIYGSIPCIWNGGRIVNSSTNGLNIINTVKPFNLLGVGIRFTFTNSLIDENNIHDSLGNQILELCKNPENPKARNSVNVSKQIMMDYIEKNYPEYYCLWSTTLWLKDIDKINELSKDHILVLDYSLNNKFDIIKKLEHPENIEILCSEVCTDNCPYRKEHYEEISKYNMNYPVEFYACHSPGHNKSYYETACASKSYVSIEDIREKYLSLGINKFKLNGRGESKVNVIERYINYLVKPEYRDIIRNKLLLSEFSNN